MPLRACCLSIWRVVVAALVGTTLCVQAADITWSNPVGGGWNTAANWNPNQVPGPSDTATLALGVTVTVDADVTVSNVVLSAGTLAGSATLTVSGTMSWTGGAMRGNGATAIASGASLNISGGNDKTFAQRTLNNAGMFIWSGGNLNSGNGAVLNNLAGGVFDLQSDQGWGDNDQRARHGRLFLPTGVRRDFRRSHRQRAGRGRRRVLRALSQ